MDVADVILIVICIVVCVVTSCDSYVRCKQLNRAWFKEVMKTNDLWSDFVSDMIGRLSELERQVLELSRDKQEGGNDENQATSD